MITFSVATLADVDTLEQIETACFADPWNEGMLASELQMKDSRYVLMKEDDCIVGYYSYTHIVDEAHILNVAVLPDYQGRGLGKMLMRHLLDNLPADVRAVTLEVREGNTRAIRLYEGCGFVCAGVRRQYYMDKENALIYWLVKGDRVC